MGRVAWCRFFRTCVPPEKPAFVRVDDLLPRISLEQVATFYGVELPEMKRIGAEVRSRCFLQCGRTCETGDRALAIQADEPTKKWKCFQSGCGKSGNLVSVADLLKPGENAGGKPRGDRFKAIAADLVAITEGLVRGVDVPQPKKQTEPEPVTNLPLKDITNERARALVTLDDKFVLDYSLMPPRASSYFRTRPYLTPEVCKAHRLGYFPRDAGENKSGGTMRGRIVFPFLSDSGELLTWFGLDPEFAEKHAEWEKSDRKDREPTRYHFVKGFHWGIELWGQHLVSDPAARPRLESFGLPLVPEPTDAILLAQKGLPGVALIQPTITREQAAKVGRLARAHAGGKVTIFLNCDEAGETLMKQCLGFLAQECFVRLAWTARMHGGKFKDRAVGSLRDDEWPALVGDSCPNSHST